VRFKQLRTPSFSHCFKIISFILILDFELILFRFLTSWEFPRYSDIRVLFSPKAPNKDSKPRSDMPFWPMSKCTIYKFDIFNISEMISAPLFSNWFFLKTILLTLYWIWFLFCNIIWYNLSIKCVFRFMSTNNNLRFRQCDWQYCSKRWNLAFSTFTASDVEFSDFILRWFYDS